MRSGLSQKDIARKTGISQSSVAKYENGTQVPSYEVGTKIFDLLLDAEPINEPDLVDLMQTEIIFLKTTTKLEEAIEDMKKYSISQLPVKDTTGKIVGTINESGLLDVISQFRDLSTFRTEKIASIMNDPMPIIPHTGKVSDVSSLLKRYGGVLISRRGDIIGIVTKADLIYY